MSSYLLTVLTKKQEVETIIRDTIDKVLVLRFGRASDPVCLQLDDVNLPTAVPGRKTIPWNPSTKECWAEALDEPQNLEVERMSRYLLTVLTKKQEVDTIIRDTIDKVLVLRFGHASDPVCLQLNDVLSKSAWEVSKFASVALVDIDSNEIQVYVKTADHTKWVGAFHKKQDFIDVVEAIYRGAMKGKLIVNCPLPPERIPKYQLLYKDV